MSQEIHNWELQKENAAPLERGRNVSKLSKALATPSTALAPRSTQNDQDANIVHFESLVKPSERFAARMSEYLKQTSQEGTNESLNSQEEEQAIERFLSKAKVDKDPIIHWMGYIKYHEETYPTDTHSQFLLKERCTRALLHHPKYTNDCRFIRVCLLYADHLDNSHEQFKYYHKNRIGLKTALFWIGWAWVAEKKGNYKFADKIFQKAIDKKAKPIDKVQERYKQFQRRMSRLWLNNDGDEDNNLGDGEEEEEEEEDQADERRNVLSGLTEEGVQYNHRSRRANATSSHVYDPNTGSYRPRNNQQRNNNAQQNGNSNQGDAKSDGFFIFTDENENGVDYDLNQSRMPDSRHQRQVAFAKDVDQRKENTVAAECWNERGGLRSMNNGVQDEEEDESEEIPASSVAQRWAGFDRDAPTGGISSQPAFQVFVDEECVSKPQEEEETKGPSKPEVGLNMRKRLDDEQTSLKRKKLPLGGSTIADKFKTDKSKDRQSTKETTNEYNGKSKRHKASGSYPKYGFDKHLLSSDKYGEECCFEERRAQMKYFQTIRQDENFNMLQKKLNEFQNTEVSGMDLDDESSVDDEIIQNSSSIIHNEEHSTIESESHARPPLYHANTSIQNQEENNVTCASTNSSTINDHDAVGVFEEREETINTKFAAKELSMLFSSPVVGESDNDCIDPNSPKPSTQKEGLSSSVLFSVHNPCPSDDVPDHTPMQQTEEKNRRLGLYSISENKSNETEDQSGPGFQIFQSDEAEEQHEKGPGFQIFQSDEVEEQQEGPGFKSFQSDKAEEQQGPGFKIFEADDVEEQQGPGFQIFQSEEAVDKTGQGFQSKVDNNPDKHGQCQSELNEFTIFEDNDGIDEAKGCIPDSSFDGNMKKDMTESTKIPGVTGISAIKTRRENEDWSGIRKEDRNNHNEEVRGDGEKRDFSAYFVEDEVKIKDDTTVFGDISLIAGTTLDLHESMQQISINERACDTDTTRDVLDYSVVNKKNMKIAMDKVLQQAAKQRRKKNSKASASVHVFDRTNNQIPSGLRKVPKTGTVIDIGEFEFLVEHELGRGAFGTVLLCDLYSDIEQKFALKVQIPTGCLAWEFEVLKTLWDRLHHENMATNKLVSGIDNSPFPRPQSFVALADGSVLGMTAGSESGLNLVDVINVHVAHSGTVPELLAIYYTYKMLKHLQTLHFDANILHCDIKSDNWVLTSKKTTEGTVCDLMLVDFGRSIDMLDIAKDESKPFDIYLTGDIAAEDNGCVAMRENLPWSVDIDTFGLCATAHTLLFGCYMEIVMDKRENRWKPRRKLRRYWQRDLWHLLFDTLINCDGNVLRDVEMYSAELQKVINAFEEYLDNRNRQREVQSILNLQAGLLPKMRSRKK